MKHNQVCEHLLLLNFHNKLLPMAALMMLAEMLMVTSVVVWI